MKDGQAIGGFVAGMAIMLMFWIMIDTSDASDRVFSRHVTQALEVCENNGGLSEIRGRSNGRPQFHCENGAVFTFGKIGTDNE